MSASTGNFVTADGSASKVVLVGDSDLSSDDAQFTSSLNVYGTAKFIGFVTVDDTNLVCVSIK